MVNSTISYQNHTENEISQQAALWQEVFFQLCSSKAEIANFLRPVLQLPDLRIILTGAGSSAFIGEAALSKVMKDTKKVVQAIATTDIITHAKDLSLAETPTLLVSFARSGNSPESVEAVNLMNMSHQHIYHLFITCNKDGELAGMEMPKDKPAFKIILPESTNDKGLAMTGSFTSMLLTGLLCFDIENILSYEHEVENICKSAMHLLNQTMAIQALATLNFSRAIFLGSGPLLGIARECHLKLQELTDGKVVCKHDSFLGFRHGPRVVANQDAVLIYFYSDDAFVRKYEYDLTDQIARENPEIPVLSYGGDRTAENTISIHLGHVDNNKGLNILPYTMIGQLLGYYKSLQLGLNPDNPSVSGAISRVVQGVTIYNNNVLS